jgi:hypothetical protein
MKRHIVFLSALFFITSLFFSCNKNGQIGLVKITENGNEYIFEAFKGQIKVKETVL